MFVINPDPYSLPAYRIGPFQTRDLSVNHKLPDSVEIDSYFEERFQGKEYLYTFNGREAIHLSLSECKLQADDVVTILTTSGNFYISGCVTKEIERFCSWSRKIEPETKAIFVNHEFGFPFKDLSSLKKYGVPIIEDCAVSFFSFDEKRETGTIGDFVIYSFPKMFPLQIGGLLVSNTRQIGELDSRLSKEEIRHIRNVLSANIGLKDSIIKKRIENFDYLTKAYKSIGFSARFELNPDVVPGVFMFKTEGNDIDLPKLKEHFWEHGIQCSVFYGEESFFIPVHQRLEKDDLDYFVEVMKAFA